MTEGDAERDGDPSHAVQAALGALRAEAERLVRRRYRENRPDLIRSDLARLARRAGLAARLQPALTRGLQAVDRGVRQELEAAFIRANTPGPVPEAIDAARASAPVQAAYSGALRRGLSDLARSDRAIEREVVPLVEEAVREGKGVRHVAGLLEERIGAKAHAARVAVATARAAYDRAARVELAHGAGERLGVPVRYRYTGPPPERAFCRTHLGRVYTRDEIAALPTEQGLPPLYYGGGYGCRHRWVIVLGDPGPDVPAPALPEGYTLHARDASGGYVAVHAGHDRGPSFSSELFVAEQYMRTGRSVLLRPESTVEGKKSYDADVSGVAHEFKRLTPEAKNHANAVQRGVREAWGQRARVVAYHIDVDEPDAVGVRKGIKNALFHDVKQQIERVDVFSRDGSRRSYSRADFPPP